MECCADGNVSVGNCEYTIKKKKKIFKPTCAVVPLKSFSSVLDFGEFISVRAPGPLSEGAGVGEGAMLKNVPLLGVAKEQVIGRLDNRGG